MTNKFFTFSEILTQKCNLKNGAASMMTIECGIKSVIHTAYVEITGKLTEEVKQSLSIPELFEEFYVNFNGLVTEMDEMDGISGLVMNFVEDTPDVFTLRFSLDRLLGETITNDLSDEFKCIVWVNNRIGELAQEISLNIELSYLNDEGDKYMNKRIQQLDEFKEEIEEESRKISKDKLENLGPWFDEDINNLKHLNELIIEEKLQEERRMEFFEESLREMEQ